MPTGPASRPVRSPCIIARSLRSQQPCIMTSSSTAYHPISVDKDAQRYKEEAVSVSSDPAEASQERFELKRRRRAIQSIFISLFIGLYMTFLMARAVFPSQFTRGSRKALCQLSVHRFAQGMYMNLSTARLPSHYTLPSGDKIPAVGLGEFVGSTA